METEGINSMRTLLVGLFALLFMMGSSAGLLAAQDDATPEDESAAAAESNPLDPQTGDVVTYFTEENDPVATFTVTDVEFGWEGFDEFSEPPAGSEFVAIAVEVENITERSSFDVSQYRFGLQDSLGHFWSTTYVGVEEDPEPPLLEDDLSIEGGATEAFTLIFVINEDTPLGYLYYSDSGVLLTLANLSEK